MILLKMFSVSSECVSSPSPMPTTYKFDLFRESHASWNSQYSLTPCFIFVLVAFFQSCRLVFKLSILSSAWSTLLLRHLRVLLSLLFLSYFILLTMVLTSGISGCFFFNVSFFLSNSSFISSITFCILFGYCVSELVYNHFDFSV